MKTIGLILAFLLVPSPGGADDRWVERTLRSMTPAEKVGQLLMARIGPEGWRSFDAPEMAPVRRAITELRVGSLHAGIGDAATMGVKLGELQRLAKVPMLTAANLEAGAGYVLYGATRMPTAMAIAATGDERFAYEVARIAAVEGRASGVNVNFFPVADVNNNPENPIINVRSFGEDPATVSRFVAAYVRGAQEHGQLATPKHFPGHGDVTVDSHLAMPTLDVARERLDAVELPPFRAAFDAGAGALMTAHIHLPRFDPEEEIPATLSPAVLTDLLREDLGFGGVVFTDSMGMRGVSVAWEAGEATVRAIEAGADIVIGSPDLEASYRALREAVESGRIPTERLDASVRRILRAKAALGLHTAGATKFDAARLSATTGNAAHRALAQDVADRAITLVRNEGGVLPLRPSSALRVVQINLLDTRSGWREGPVGRIMTTELPKRFPRAVTVQVDDQTTPAELDLVRKLASLADALVVNAFVRVASYKGSIDLGAPQSAFLREIIAMDKPLAFTAFGNPYLLAAFPELPAYAVTYDISGIAEHAAVKAIAGEIPYRGRLPIRLGDYPIGHGLAP